MATKPKAATAASAQPPETPQVPKKRQKPVPQTDIPSVSLDDALRVPRALLDNYGNQAVSPLDAAQAIGMQPGSGPFRNLLGAATAYGLTDGGAWAATLNVTSLGRRVLRPTADGDDLVAMREAFLTPRVPREFLTAYNGNKVPREDIGRNVLVQRMGVPDTATKRVFDQILYDARKLGYVVDIKGVEYVRLQGGAPAAAITAPSETAVADEPTDAERPSLDEVIGETNGTTPAAAGPAEPKAAKDERAGRVYITHGKNKDFVDLLKKFLKYGDMEAVVSTEKETVSLPVTEKVIGDMRSCGAALIHVDAERRLIDADGKEHIVINPNVLIEIGAAVALYGRRFILLVREGVDLPSNLHGLYEVRYDGDTLDAGAAMRLLESIADIKNHDLP